LKGLDEIDGCWSLNLLSGKITHDQNEEEEDYMSRYESFSEVEMELNKTLGTLRFIINSKDKIAYENDTDLKNTEVSFAVTLKGSSQRIRICPEIKGQKKLFIIKEKLNLELTYCELYEGELLEEQNTPVIIKHVDGIRWK